MYHWILDNDPKFWIFSILYLLLFNGGRLCRGVKSVSPISRYCVLSICFKILEEEGQGKETECSLFLAKWESMVPVFTNDWSLVYGPGPGPCLWVHSSLVPHLWTVVPALIPGHWSLGSMVHGPWPQAWSLVPQITGPWVHWSRPWSMVQGLLSLYFWGHWSLGSLVPGSWAP